MHGRLFTMNCADSILFRHVENAKPKFSVDRSLPGSSFAEVISASLVLFITTLVIQWYLLLQCSRNSKLICHKC